MAEVRSVARVFLASPSDLSQERKIAKRVVDEFNDLFAAVFGYHVELVGWEDSVSVFGRPQEVINRELAQCELFVGLLWKRWGTPPAVAGPYSSGFEEEYSLSVTRREAEGRPEISLFFKDVPPDAINDAGPELSKVIAFKNKLIDEKKLLFEAFTDTSDFETKFRRCLSKYIVRLRDKAYEESAASGQAPTTSGENQTRTDDTARWSSPFAAVGVAFIRRFVAQAESQETFERLTAADVARFRLLNTLVGRPGNDDDILGTHDANILYAARNDYDFGSGEVDGLISTGLESYSSENKPLWYWLARSQLGPALELIYYASITSRPDRRVGAFSAMALLAEPLPTTLFSRDRQGFVSDWLQGSQPNAVRLAAIRYLAHYGNSTDLRSLPIALDTRDSEIRTAAAAAMIRISLRNSREEAFDAALELQPITLDPRLIAQIFANHEAIPTDKLHKALVHSNHDIRRFAVSILCERDELTDEITDKLLKDAHVEVRYEALIAAMVRGRSFSDEEAKSVLVVTAPRSGLGYISWLRQTDDDSYWKRYQIAKLRQLSDESLSRRAREDVPFAVDAYLVLAERQFGRYGPQIRRAIDDQYTSEFQEWMDRLASWAKSETIEKIRGLEPQLRKQFTGQSLELLCRKGNARDLGRVRKAVTDGGAEYSEAIVTFFAKHGEWRDIPLVIALLTKSSGALSGGLFSAFTVDNEMYRTAAGSLYAMGHTRLPELLALEMPADLLRYIVLLSKEKDFRQLQDETVLSLLASASDGVRRAVALKCVKSFARSRTVQLLATYLGRESRYYNVIHWLDLITLPFPQARRMAQRKLDSEV